MLLIVGKYKSDTDFPEEIEIINEILETIEGKEESSLSVFSQIEHLALIKLNKTDDGT